MRQRRRGGRSSDACLTSPLTPSPLAPASNGLVSPCDAHEQPSMLQEFMLKMRHSKLSKVWPANLDKQFVGLDGLWDPVRSMESSASGGGERFERSGRNEERELKRRSANCHGERECVVLTTASR